MQIKQLLTKLKHLFNTESKLSADQRAQNEWVLICNVHGLKITVGKGGANTVFYSLGEKAERNICYPVDIVELFQKRSERKYEMYLLNDTPIWSDKTAIKKVKPKPGYTIHGMTETGDKELVYKAKKGLTQTAWIKV